jgi:hypothetical protein
MQLTSVKVEEALIDLGYRAAAEGTKEGTLDLSNPETGGKKILKAVIIIQSVAKELQKDLGIPNHFVVFALSNVLRYWERV